ncbi:Hint domain-containing protein [Kangsaoukella pontilimi]|nr:Hint domain-containing protein [Kangsaoukella pontilimi]
MTRVRTIFGDVHAVALRKGDEILTASGEYKPILWLNRVLLDQAFLAEKPDSHPVCIRAGAFGGKAPSNDILVSPRQIVETPEGRFEEAASLIGQAGVSRFSETGLSYTMFHLGRPESVVVEGALLRTAPPVN